MTHTKPNASLLIITMMACLCIFSTKSIGQSQAPSAGYIYLPSNFNRMAMIRESKTPDTPQKGSPYLFKDAKTALIYLEAGAPIQAKQVWVNLLENALEIMIKNRMHVFGLTNVTLIKLLNQNDSHVYLYNGHFFQSNGGPLEGFLIQKSDHEDTEYGLYEKPGIRVKRPHYNVALSIGDQTEALERKTSFYISLPNQPKTLFKVPRQKKKLLALLQEKDRKRADDFIKKQKLSDPGKNLEAIIGFLNAQSDL